MTCHSRTGVIIQLMIAEFHLAARVSGSWFCECLLAVIVMGLLKKMRPSLMFLVTPELVLLWQARTSPV